MNQLTVRTKESSGRNWIKESSGRTWITTGKAKECAGAGSPWWGPRKLTMEVQARMRHVATTH